MPVILASNFFYNLSLGDQRLNRLLNETRAQATHMGLLDEIKDWFYSGQKKNCLNLMYSLLHDVNTFKVAQQQQLKALLLNADPRDLTKFWHAHNEQGDSLMGAAILNRDRETAACAGALLKFFPLHRFDSEQFSILIGCANQRNETVLALAIAQNRPDLVEAFASFYQFAMTLRASVALNTVDHAVDNDRISCFVFCRHISDALEAAINSALFHGVSRCLTRAQAYQSSALSGQYAHLLESFSHRGSLNLLASALRDDSSQAEHECFASLLAMLDREQRSSFIHNYLQNDLESTVNHILFVPTTEVGLLRLFNRFDRYASVLQRLDLCMPEGVLETGHRSTMVNFKNLMRKAFNHERYRTVLILLTLINDDNLPRYLPAIASQTRDLSARADRQGLKTLLKSGRSTIQKAVLEALDEDPYSLDRLAGPRHRVR